MARTLSHVAQTKDPVRRLSLATEAQRMLATWPAAHYGYRARDVAQLSALLDEAVAELRVAAGLSRFDLALVATNDGRRPTSRSCRRRPNRRASRLRSGPRR